MKSMVNDKNHARHTVNARQVAEGLCFLLSTGTGTQTQTDTDPCPGVANILAGETDQGPVKGYSWCG